MSLVLKQQAKEALWERFRSISPYQIDSKGYLKDPTHNLLPGVRLEHFESELDGGSGNELKGKFLAVHSSSALAVNTFAPMKGDPNKLNLRGINGFNSIKFEQKLSTGLSGTPPNIDLIAENETEVLAIESKFLEYFGPKKPNFSSSYTKKNLPKAEDKWLDLITYFRNSTPMYLDVAQLIKHYLGLRNTAEYANRKITLMYLFWEPENTSKFDIFEKHRNELINFTKYVSGSSIEFIYKSYPELWSEWESKRLNKKHLINLNKRYHMSI
jgi:hypothetical protein